MNSEISNTKTSFNFLIPQKYFLPLILIAAVFVRIIFFNGLVFSDDSYYNWLSFQFLDGSYNSGFAGYPIFLIRKFSTLFNSLFFALFGYNEIVSVLFPFILSILSVILVYKISEELINQKKISLIASFLAAFFPVDIIFASINFSDLECVFFINLGIYFYIKAARQNNNIYYVIAGICLSVSILFKEYAYYYLILLAGYFLYNLFLGKKSRFQSMIPLLIISVFLCLEGIYYLITENNFYYRFSIFRSNYIYCYYDFFPYTQANEKINFSAYLISLVKHIGNNIKYLFVRRHYLFLPIFAVVQSCIFIKKKEQRFLLVWFAGLMVLMPLMTVSLTTYSPIELRRIWYIYPLVIPFSILTASLVSKLRPIYLSSVLLFYFAGSVIMSVEFQNFFDMRNKNHFKQFIKDNSEKIIYTDHHTAYGIRFINGFTKNSNVKIFTNADSLRTNMDELIVYSRQVIAELKKQNYNFPDFNVLRDDRYKLVTSIGQFEVYERIK